MADPYSAPPPPPPAVALPQPRYWPKVTLAIMAVTAVVFLLMEWAGGSTNPDVLLEFGAAYGPYFRQGEYGRLVMPMFLHIGWLHIALNMYALYVLGPLLERVYGYGRFALIYVASGMASSLLSMSVSNNVAAGASGAIFGVAGAMLVTGYLHRQAVPRRWARAFGKGLLILIVLNLILGLTIPHIDNWGHVGGLVGGATLAWLIPPPAPEMAMGEASSEQFVLLIPVAVVALAMAATFRSFRLAQEVTRLLAEGDRVRIAKQSDRAAEFYQRAASRDPKDERPHEALGALYLSENRTTDAIREYEQALRLSPGSPRAQLGLALAYRQQGDIQKAQKLIESVLGKNPSTAEGQMALADLCGEQKLYPEAIQHYQAALQLQPDLAVAHNNLAWLYATAEDSIYRNPQQALEHARRAVELSQWKEAAFIDTLAEALYINGKFDEAVKVQTRALELDPNNQDLKDHMARYRDAAGKSRASLNMLIETPGGFNYTGSDGCRWMLEACFRKTYAEHLVGPDSTVVGIK